METVAFILLLMSLGKANSLVCYMCSSESGNSTCSVYPKSSKWELCNGQCQVWRLFSEVDDSVYMFERSCNSLCREGCTFLSDMEHRFVGCSTCCDTDFCNVGKHTAPSVSGRTLLLVIVSKLFL
ncbi:unnamed protein product [Auanema sp. JU1783]|nr:unnamed protein product [Auanema sp. JU1783]